MNSNPLIIKSFANTFTPLKEHLAQGVRILNHPVNKEIIKKTAGVITFAFGLIAVYDLVQILRGRKISSELPSRSTHWTQTAQKVILVCAKISLIISACGSRTAVILISRLAGRIFTLAQLESAFGPNIAFLLDPRFISILAAALALPSIVLSVYAGAKWAYRELSYAHTQYQNNRAPNAPNRFLTDIKVRLMTLFNTVTSPVALQIGNRFARLLLRPL